MAITALNIGETRDYISRLDPHHPDKKDADVSKATKWKLRTLDARVYGYLKDQLTDIGYDGSGNPIQRTHANRMYLETVRFGLVDWANFKDHTGKEMRLVTVQQRIGNVTYDVLHDDVLGQIPDAVITELAIEIRKGNTLTEDDAKN